MDAGARGVTLAEWLGVAGFVISLALAVLKIRETWFLKPKYEPNFIWFNSEDPVGPRLEFAICNVGHAPEVITGASFRPSTWPEERPGGLVLEPIYSALPIPLDVGGVTRLMKMEVNVSEQFYDGHGCLVLSGPRKFKQVCKIPPWGWHLLSGAADED